MGCKNSPRARETTTTTKLQRWEPYNEPDSRPRYHQTATSLLLPLPEVLTSAHINKVDDHRKGRNHTQAYKQLKGKLVKKLSYHTLNHTISYSDINGRHPYVRHQNHIRHQNLTIQIRSMRHHHETVELHPSSEASPRGLRGIIPLQEAPPRGLRGITSWPWGTTTLPSWNYVLVSRHHREPSPQGSWN